MLTSGFSLGGLVKNKSEKLWSFSDSWKALLAALFIAFVLNIVLSTLTGTSPSRNITWTTLWVFLTIKAWKNWGWKAFLPYPCYLLIFIIFGVLLAVFGYEQHSAPHLILATTCNIGGLVLFATFLTKSYAKVGLERHVPKDFRNDKVTKKNNSDTDLDYTKAQSATKNSSNKLGVDSFGKTQWYYADGNIQKGPIETEKIIELIKSLKINKMTLVWSESMPAWAPANETGLNKYFSSQPPPLPTEKDVPPPLPSQSIGSKELFSQTTPPPQNQRSTGSAGSKATYSKDPSKENHATAGNALPTIIKTIPSGLRISIDDAPFVGPTPVEVKLHKGKHLIQVFNGGECVHWSYFQKTNQPYLEYDVSKKVKKEEFTFSPIEEGPYLCLKCLKEIHESAGKYCPACRSSEFVVCK